MKKKYIAMVVLFLLLYIPNINGQNFSVDLEHTELSGKVGTDLEFPFIIRNLSSKKIVLYVVKKNSLPENWTSYFCLSSCFAASLDSLTITEDFGADTLASGETAVGSLHINIGETEGTGTVKLKVGDLNNPSDVKSFNIVGTTSTVSVEDNSRLPANFSLNQNYPNPFNPTTTISFTLPKSEHVLLKVYNVLGKEVATVINRQLSKGKHQVQFSSHIKQSNLSSGVYYYKISTNSFSDIKKMILIK